MRYIKFRGKRKDNGEWVDGSYVYAHKWFGSGEAGHFIVGIYGDERTLIDPKTLGQCTGLKDKNGKDIFEGDFLKSRHNVHPYKVYYNENKFLIEDKWGNSLRPTQDAISWFECEVIGNRWDNPELWEEEQ